MPLKKVTIGLTDEIKESMDILLKSGLYKNTNTLAATAVGQLIKREEYALKTRKKAFSKEYTDKSILKDIVFYSRMQL